MVRRALSVLLALTFTLEVPGQARATTQAAAPAGSPALTDVDARAEALFEEGKYLAAAKVWEDALAAAPESLAVRGQRNGWVTGAVNAYKKAFDAQPTRCAAIHKSLRLADEYLEALLAVYGLPARNADDYQGMSKRRAELDQARSEQRCEEPGAGAAAPPAPTTVQPAPVVARPEGPADVEARPEPRRGSPGLAAGIGVSAALAVTMLATSVALYLPLRKGSGKYYQNIVEAADMNNVPTDKQHDMCVEGQGVPAVKSACDEWKSVKTGFVVTAVLAGVFAASTAVFTGLLIRKRRQSDTLAALRERRVQLGAAPRREGGVMLVGGLSF
ncbi:MAG: hypothetical protein JNK56_08970 [Myxococcales bacterium]|nr:hypothetical protein [Myxococcales bacterium]